MSSYEAVIGLEIHAELKTASKMFCSCDASFGGEPNAKTCPVCLGHPGVLPVLNHKAVELATRLALALDYERVKITVAKNRRDPKENPRGLIKKFKIYGGYQISHSRNPWGREVEKDK